MNNNKSFNAKSVVSVIALILIIGGGAYYAGLKNSNIKQSAQSTENLNQTVPISNTTYATTSSAVPIPTPVKKIMNSQNVEKVQVYVNVIDKDGKAFRPDKVEWYYQPVGGQVTQYPAKCVNSGCTRWSVTGANSSKIYVVANYATPSNPNAKCFSASYNAKPVDLSSIPTEITLIMKLESYCE